MRVFRTVSLNRLPFARAVALARALGEHGVETTLALLGGELDEARRQAFQDCPGVKWLITGLPDEDRWESPDVIAHVADALSRMANVLDPGLVHLSDPALAIGAHFNAPVLADCGESIAVKARLRGTSLPFELAWRVDLDRKGHAAAQRLVANSPAAAQAVMATYGLVDPPDTLPALPPLTQPLDVTRREDFVLASLGDADSGGLAALDRAAAELKVPIMLVGDAAGASPQHIWALGELDEAQMSRWCATSPLFIGAALKILDAGDADWATAHGCALVLSDIPAHRDIWDGAALFVPPGQAASLVAAVRGLLGNPAARAQLAAAAAERLGARKEAGTTQQWLAFYRRAAQPSDRSAAAE
jgi:hypothetical protein